MTEWAVVVPVKGSTASKTRLADFPLSPVERRRLALAFAEDTVTAILDAPDVRQLFVVTSDTDAAAALGALGAQIVPDPTSGLNTAVAAGLQRAHELHPDASVAVITADLPMLRSSDVVEALERAAQHPKAFVADADGTGTTTLTAGPLVPVVPQFGLGSAERHAAAGFVALSVAGTSTLRHDVDTPADLEAALRAGVGPHTARALAHPLD